MFNKRENIANTSMKTLLYSVLNQNWEIIYHFVTILYNNLLYCYITKQAEYHSQAQHNSIILDKYMTNNLMPKQTHVILLLMFAFLISLHKKTINKGAILKIMVYLSKYQRNISMLEDLHNWNLAAYKQLLIKTFSWPLKCTKILDLLLSNRKGRLMGDTSNQMCLNYI